MTYRNALNAIDLRLQFNIALHLIPCFQYSRVDLQAKVRFSEQEISRAAQIKKTATIKPNTNNMYTLAVCVCVALDMHISFQAFWCRLEPVLKQEWG